MNERKRNNGDQWTKELMGQAMDQGNERSNGGSMNERNNGKIKWMGKSETMEGSKWTKETMGGLLNNNYFKQ